MREWEFLQRDLSHPERIKQYTSISGYIRSVNDQVYTLCYYRDNDVVPNFFSQILSQPCSCTYVDEFCSDCPQSTPDLVILSIVLLAELLSAGLVLYGFKDSPEETDHHTWPRVKFLKQRMLRGGWCRQEIRRFCLQGYTSTSLFYISSMSRGSLGFQHDGCNDFRCSREQIDNKTYRTVHSDGCSKSPRRQICKMINFDPLFDRRISDLVCQHLTPVITATSDSNSKKIQITIRATEKAITAHKARIINRIIQPGAIFNLGEESLHRERLPYVCISHVWSE